MERWQRAVLVVAGLAPVVGMTLLAAGFGGARRARAVAVLASLAPGK